MENPSGERIGEILLENGFVTKENLEEALNLQKKEGGLIGVILVRKSFVKEENLAFALARQFHYPFLSLENVIVNRNLVKEIGRDFLSRYAFIPIEKTPGILVIAMADPSDESALKAIENKTKTPVLAFVASLNQIEEQMQKVFGGKASQSERAAFILKKATDEKSKEHA